MKKYEMSWKTVQLDLMVFAFFMPLGSSFIWDDNIAFDETYLIKVFVYYLMAGAIGVLITIWLNNFYRNVIKFSKDGITCLEKESSILSWNDLEVENKENITPRLFGGSCIIHLKDRRSQKIVSKIILNPYTEKSIYKLTQEFVPKENELYSVIKNYSLKRKDILGRKLVFFK